ncbi:type II toxin-antitoxin system VapB family antitoxin [Streptomyces sp. NPDC059837]|jgi:Arc/MetJ family transcription regulator|uniref:type II toxin-antitoxin system VapB family antitoxin n=1 Tax=unclassified Streptomyces TaxID=2593676 RepID=UPI0022511509|nr:MULTISPECIES: type II toxin-antitoxin system VapB family antitoxin [unclassified Streptomyces]MCX4407867.1 type II toxin-antitoxin system VapB family antitoxin [Streptomyces sp. NBC_01764]MCX5187409.1 type II toxin-antitoxin system VapB family antitoxin [Streptomyces sp. NBC_00268]
MARTVIDLDETMVAEAMRIFGTKTKAQAVRLAMEDAVKRHLRQEGFDAMDAGDFDFSEIIESTGPRNGDGTLKREGGRAA